MAWSYIVVLSALLALSWSAEDLVFPPGFKFGAATASYQVEGGWNASDKSESTWDRFCHEDPNRIIDQSSGDVACDSYNQWTRDIEMAEELGLHFYRFSLAWPRLLPTGFTNYISEDGKNYYNNLIDGLLEKGIEPLITLYHWDMPQSIQDLGKVSIANHMLWIEPKTEEDAELAEMVLQNTAGRYSHPIFSKEGGWPAVIEKHFEKLSKKKGYAQSILPAFTPEEIEFVKGTYDFYGMNHYTSRVVRKANEGEKFRPAPLGDIEDLNAILETRPEWPQAASSWFFTNPAGIRHDLVWLKQQYGDIEFVITENGFPTKGGLNDLDRVEYYRAYLKEILIAIKEYGVNVTRYTAWTLMDNFEWTDGYENKFGLYEVDFSDPKRKRTPRDSARYYASVIKAHSLNVPTTRDEL